ncbi:carbon-nitrogen hydrolase family protein [Rhodoplanes serenus]|jgi:predicted amidohydrolase|uniref:Hydrolase n=1 Tax=Rhodoplanes serenus TaxID=200615 RepID=A0A327JXN6_9BRAD|nr:carbon-nitrogen hydrolase family protein [Rhodoplanes serenus]MBI5111593.1 carbon-nitrogen hydrolase family protein [Rhodovulum sp.]MTW14629.1 carbon-nitrogen hydrolase family protein [Rhodoplanes serenus]RAI31249.1 amidohydrolase [Rhodoplanes serenus]VCU09863.1 Hydrolase [Rhodoplanes serenus]
MTFQLRENSTFRVALVQLQSGRRPSANIDAAIKLIGKAKERGAHYVQTPEMTNLMESDRARLLELVAPEESDPGLAALRDTARRHRLWLHIGSLAVKVGPDLAANRTFLIDPDGEVVATYDKIHMFDVDLPGGESYRESRMFQPGDRAVVADLPWGRLGLSICYDLRFPALYRALAEAGSSFLAIPAAFTRQTGEAHWHVLMRARAIENGCYIFAAAQGGLHESGRETFGRSLVVDPWGVVIAEHGTQPGFVMAEIDPAAVTAARSRIPSLQHGRRFELVEPTAAAVRLHALHEAK